MPYDFNREVVLTLRMTESQALKMLGLIVIGQRHMEAKGDFDSNDDVLVALVSRTLSAERRRLNGGYVNDGDITRSNREQAAKDIAVRPARKHKNTDSSDR